MVSTCINYRLARKCGYMNAATVTEIRCCKDIVHVETSYPRRAEPRISVNDLALYMLSSDTARIGIVRRAKHPQAPPIIRYRDARGPICAFLADLRRDVNPLVAAEEMFRQRMADPAEGALRQDDARQSIEVLHALQRMRNQLAPFEFVAAPADQGRLELAGVEVSVRADLLVLATSRGVNQFGAAVLRMTQDDADTEPARTRRRDIGLYVATLARLTCGPKPPER